MEQTQMRNLKTRTAVIIMNAKSFPIGDKVEGTWESNRVRMVNDTQTNTLKEVTDLVFKKDDGKKVAIPLDAGLRVALSEFNVKEGEYVQLEKLPQIDYKGNKINQYNVLVAD
tara:strand:+ start:2814 stop:3152 length:339 start_codon:yes stop_codon:yes gene_type:complete